MSATASLVSVPWRGLWSFGWDIVVERNPGMVAFPSPGGDYGLSDHTYTVTPGTDHITFPSPGGDYGLSDYVIYVTLGPAYILFPSPGGDYGLSDSIRSKRCMARRYSVSVPWRGLRSFGPTATVAGLFAFTSFRPLAGITVFRTGSPAIWG